MTYDFFSRSLTIFLFLFLIVCYCKGVADWVWKNMNTNWIRFYWIFIGFEFSDCEPSALVQRQGGPCAVIAPVQAYLLKFLLSEAASLNLSNVSLRCAFSLQFQLVSSIQFYANKILTSPLNNNCERSNIFWHVLVLNFLKPTIFSSLRYGH